MYGIPSFQLEIIIGLLLNDAWLNIETDKKVHNCKIRFKKSIINLPFVCSIVNHLSHYYNNLPYKPKTIQNDKLFYGVSVKTRALPVLTILYNLFYPCPCPLLLIYNFKKGKGRGKDVTQKLFL